MGAEREREILFVDHSKMIEKFIYSSAKSLYSMIEKFRYSSAKIEIITIKLIV
jgi:hypothetical protein